MHRPGKVDTQEQSDAIPSEHASNSRHLGQILRDKQGFQGMDIHIIDGNGVNSHGGHQARIIPDPFKFACKLVVLIKEGSSRISPLHTAVKIIPVINHPQPVHRVHHFVQPFNILQAPDQAQQVKDPVENSCR
ncbi:hypothetical protein D3C73_1003780 [compost metagenome]